MSQLLTKYATFLVATIMAPVHAWFLHLICIFADDNSKYTMNYCYDQKALGEIEKQR